MTFFNNINQLKWLYLIVVDTTQTVAFTSPLHRSFHKRSRSQVIMSPERALNEAVESEMKGLINFKRKDNMYAERGQLVTHVNT